MRSLARLRERFGRVHVNLGEPIHLDRLLERYAPDWRTAGGQGPERPRWVGPLVDELAGHVMRNINAAAAVTPVNLLALALLATPRIWRSPRNWSCSSIRCWRCCAWCPTARPGHDHGARRARHRRLWRPVAA